MKSAAESQFAWVRPLLRWFERHRRPMPWRDAPTPYAVWISEMMLQQTQVATATARFAPFVHRFPDVRTLAAASEQDVLKAWEGLGYYSRARNLHRAARHVVAHLGGELPNTAAALRELPGIGDYASAAIASIAHGEPVPAVDGNVLRVMARFRGSRSDIARPATRKALYAFLLPAIRRVDPNAFNQSLMELGALVCRPRAPRCDACPLATGCAARRAGLVQVLPVKSRPKPGPHHLMVIGVVRDDTGRLLLSRRPARGLLASLWEFPGGRPSAGETPARALGRVLRECTGLRVRAGKRLGEVKHAFSHFRITAPVYACRVSGGHLAPAGESVDLVWVTRAAIDAYPLTKVARDILTHLLAG